MQPTDLTPAASDLDEREPDDGLNVAQRARPGRLAGATSDVSTGRLGRLYLGVIFVCFLAICLAQSHGLIEFDTSLPLVLSPVSYFNTLLHLWNPTDFGGTVAQGAGFLVPQGLFFITTYLLHIPPWIAERIWLASLFTVGTWGIVRLAEALGIGNRWARVLAGVAFCIAPIMVTWVTTSGDLLAAVMLPWVLLPLVTGSQHGSTRRAAAKSGIAVALMGGSNAALVLALLPLAALWLLTRQPGRRQLSLAMWWVLSVVMACFFWVVALLVVGRFGFNYLPYTETSITTTSTASAFESVRGASAWVDYYSIHQPLLAGPWLLVSRPAAIVATAIVAALGLAGLCRRIPERLFLVVSLTFGVVVVASGFSGPWGGPFALPIQHLLQNSLAPFRNVSKFAPDVTLPLVLGFAWILSASAKRLTSGGRSARRLATRDRRRRAYRVAVMVFATVAVIVAAAPFWQGKLYGNNGFAAIPAYWQQTGAFLNEHQGDENALLVPGSNFATYTWGNPKEEPLETLASTSLEWRNLIPLGSNGYIQMLDAVEQALNDGTSPAGLAAYLERAGINYVVERNDLNLSSSGAPPPAQVHQVLTETPGLTQVASFGPYLPASQVAEGRLPVYTSPQFLRLRAVNIFRVDGASSVIHTYPADNPVVVSGDVGSLVPLAGSGVVTGRATVLSGDPKANGAADAAGATWALTDGNQRRATSFGSVRNNESYLLGPGQLLPNAVKGVPLSFEVVDGSEHQTVAAPNGGATVSASSYGSSSLVHLPADGPASAFDGNPNTAWVANAANGSVGQWISIAFQRQRQLSAVRLRPAGGGPIITKLTLTTDRGTVTRRLAPGHKTYRLAVVPGPTSFLKVTVAATLTPTRPNPSGLASGAGLSEITIPGLTFQPRMQLPTDQPAHLSDPASSVISIQRPLVNPDMTLGVGPNDDPEMARLFNLPATEWMQANGSAVPEPSSALDDLIAKIDPEPADGLQVSASTTLGGLPRFSARNLVDGANTPWIAAVGDQNPTITLSWARPASVDSVSLTLSKVAAAPTRAAITPAGGQPVIEQVPSHGGVIQFPSVVTNGLTIEFLSAERKPLVAPNVFPGTRLPVGLDAVSVPGLVTTPVPQINAQQPLQLGCGFGPSLQLDGNNVETSITGTMGDLINLDPLQITACPPLGALPVTGGSHTIEADNPLGPWEVTSLTIQPSAAPAAQQAPRRGAVVGQWSPQGRTVDVGPGPATYLVLAQNFNPAWVAHLDGDTLTPVRIDGWQQGYLVPKGAAGVVTLTVPANGSYRALLALGLLLLLGLVALALLPGRRRIEDSGGPFRRPSAWALLVFSAAALVVIGGPVALVVIPFLLVARRWGSASLGISAFVAFMLAGAAAAWTPASPGVVAGALGGPAQVASVVALAAVLAALVADNWQTGPRHVHEELLLADPVGPT